MTISCGAWTLTIEESSVLAADTSVHSSTTPFFGKNACDGGTNKSSFLEKVRYALEDFFFFRNEELFVLPRRRRRRPPRQPVVLHTFFASDIGSFFLSFFLSFRFRTTTGRFFPPRISKCNTGRGGGAFQNISMLLLFDERH